jgi:hypothetical protein
MRLLARLRNDAPAELIFQYEIYGPTQSLPCSLGSQIPNTRFPAKLDSCCKPNGAEPAKPSGANTAV